MRKYLKIERLTKNYLQGKLERLTILYNVDNNIELDICYIDEYRSRCHYDVIVNVLSNTTRFLSHNSKEVLYNISLDRQKQFEDEICKVITSVS